MLQQALKQVVNAVVVGGFGVIAQQLPAHHFCAEVGELDPHRDQRFHASSSGMGGNGNGSAIEEAPEVIALNRKPGNGVAEAWRDRPVVFRSANHPARCCGHQLLERGNGRWYPVGCLSSWREQGKIERCEIQLLCPLAEAAGAGLKAFGQLEVFTIAGRDHQHIERCV